MLGLARGRAGGLGGTTKLRCGGGGQIDGSKRGGFPGRGCGGGGGGTSPLVGALGPRGGGCLGGAGGGGDVKSPLVEVILFEAA